MHYPIPLVKSTSSSSLSLNVTPVRNTISSPIPKSSTEDTKAEKNSAKNKLDDPLPLNQSTSFIATNLELPVIDISSVNYLAYRHKLIEALLKKHYNEKQPPGDLVLNSICLNATDSRIEKKIKNRPGQNLFNIEENPEPGKALKKREWEYLHPLDHFLVQGVRKAPTSDKATDTKESISENDEVPELIDFKDQPTTPKRPLNTHFRRRASNNAKNSAKLISKPIVSVDILNNNENLNKTDNRSEISCKSETQQLYRRTDMPKVDVKLDSDSPKSQVFKLFISQSSDKNKIF